MSKALLTEISFCIFAVALILITPKAAVGNGTITVFDVPWIIEDHPIEYGVDDTTRLFLGGTVEPGVILQKVYSDPTNVVTDLSYEFKVEAIDQLKIGYDVYATLSGGKLSSETETNLPLRFEKKVVPGQFFPIQFPTKIPFSAPSNAGIMQVEGPYLGAGLDMATEGTLRVISRIVDANGDTAFNDDGEALIDSFEYNLNNDSNIFEIVPPATTDLKVLGLGPGAFNLRVPSPRDVGPGDVFSYSPEFGIKSEATVRMDAFAELNVDMDEIALQLLRLSKKNTGPGYTSTLSPLGVKVELGNFPYNASFGVDLLDTDFIGGLRVESEYDQRIGDEVFFTRIRGYNDDGTLFLDETPLIGLAAPGSTIKEIPAFIPYDAEMGDIIAFELDMEISGDLEVVNDLIGAIDARLRLLSLTGTISNVTVLSLAAYEQVTPNGQSDFWELGRANNDLREALGTNTIRFEVQVVPEPSSLAVLAAASGALAFRRGRCQP